MEIGFGHGFIRIAESDAEKAKSDFQSPSMYDLFKKEGFILSYRQTNDGVNEWSVRYPCGEWKTGTNAFLACIAPYVKAGYIDMHFDSTCDKWAVWRFLFSEGKMTEMGGYACFNSLTVLNLEEALAAKCCWLIDKKTGQKEIVVLKRTQPGIICVYHIGKEMDSECKSVAEYGKSWFCERLQCA